MASLGLALTFVLLGPPGPVVAPAEQPGEPAIAPAELPSEQASSQPVVQRPGQAPPQPEPATEPGLPSYDEQPVEPTPGEPAEQPVEPPPPSSDELPTWSTEPVREPIEDPWAAPEMRPAKLPGEPRRGVGLLVGGGMGFAVVFTRQWISALMCNDVHCGYRGNFDRLFLLGSIGMIGGGAWMEGKYRGFMRNHEQQPIRPLVGRRAAGWTLFAIGIAGMITEASLYMACYDGAKGPFLEMNGFSYTCRPTASVLMIDGSAVLSSVGFGLAMSAQAERKQQGARRGKVAMLPYASADRAGLALVGRF
jgi:hypothetical protein